MCKLALFKTENKNSRDKVKILLDINRSEFKKEKDGISIFAVRDNNKIDIIRQLDNYNVVIDNIIDNAIKYTVKGGVEITVKNHETVKITVADTGIGIPKEKQESIERWFS